MPKYNGHKNYNAWNVSLWINNDESLYQTAWGFAVFCDTKDIAATMMLDYLVSILGTTHTPDGVPYTKTNIRLAMQGM